MVFKKGVEQLKNYVKREEENCEKIDERLQKTRNERNFMDNMDQAVLNQRNMNIRILKDIIQELETDDLKLEITFSGPKSSDLPWLARESFDEQGIKMEDKGGILQASLEANQSEFVVFWVSSIIGILGGATTISDFIYQKFKNYKDTKMKVGKHEIDSSISQVELQKLIQEELERLKDEVDTLKKDLL